MHILVYNIILQLSSEYTMQKYSGNSLYRPIVSQKIVPLATSYLAQLPVLPRGPQTSRQPNYVQPIRALNRTTWYRLICTYPVVTPSVRCHFVQVRSDLKAKNNPRQIYTQTSAFATLRLCLSLLIVTKHATN